MIIATKPELEKAAKHLSKHDPRLEIVITSAGLPALKPRDNYYASLIGSIISQQLSVKAADTIEKRFLALFDSDLPRPEAILSKSIDELRAVGLSNAKANYIQDLAQNIIDGRLKFELFKSLSNDEIIAELTTIKGIGVWTAHMFLMFCMGRLDVLAIGDLGIRNGIKSLYDLKELPSPQMVEKIAKKYGWHPYESAACWYIWHSLDNAPKV